MLKIGDPAPHFALVDQHGQLRKLSDLTREKVLVLYFYPKDETPHCVAEACAFRDAFEDFSDEGAMVVGVSMDTPASHLAFAESRQLPFLLLSDPDLRVHVMYGADSAFFGLMRSRVTFVIDQEGIIRHIFQSQLQPKRHVRESLAAIREIRALVNKA